MDKVMYESHAAQPWHQSEDAAAELAAADYRERHPLPDQPDGDPPDLAASITAADQASYEFLCWYCQGHHAPDTAATFVDEGGRRFRRPFRCLCCGNETCARQWEWTHYCEPCEAGICVKGAVLQHKRFLPLGRAGWLFFLTLVPNEPIPSEVAS